MGQTTRHRKNDKPTQGSIYERTSHVVQQPIFVPEHRSGSNDGGIEERFPYSDFTLGLAPVELGGGVQRRVQVRDVDEFGNSALLGDMSDGFGTRDMHGAEIEIPKGMRLVFITK